MNNYHILQVSLVPMTNNNPPRIRIKSQLFKQSIIIPFQNEPGGDTNVFASAAIYLQSNDFNLIGKGEGNQDYNYIITDTFEPIRYH